MRHLGVTSTWLAIPTTTSSTGRTPVVGRSHRLDCESSRRVPARARARAPIHFFRSFPFSLSLWFFSFFFFPFSWQRTWMCASCSERVTVERTLHGNTRKAKTPRTSAVRACTRDVHNHGCIVAILEIAVCFPPEGIEPATLEVTHRQCPVIFLAAALKNARRVPPFFPFHSLFHSLTLSFSDRVLRRARARLSSPR